MRKLVFFLGPAGAGKTTLAKALSSRRGAAFFDMDTLLRPAAEAMMTLAGLDPNDRDSAMYKKLCRDLGYRITMDAALENLELGTDVYVVGPFTKETEDPAWIETELGRIGASFHNVEVKVVFAYLKDEELYRRRIEARGSVLDVWKLEHWAEFSRSLQIRDIQWRIPASSVLYFDNSESMVEPNVGPVESFLYGNEAAAVQVCHVSLNDVWELRHRVMWPDKDLEFVKLQDDSAGLHFGLAANGKLVSVISLFIEGDRAQFRKFATLQDEQGKGYGTRLLQFTLDEAKRREARTIWCNARASKVGLYRKFGLQETGDGFQKEGIDYVILEKSL